MCLGLRFRVGLFGLHFLDFALRILGMHFGPRSVAQELPHKESQSLNPKTRHPEPFVLTIHPKLKDPRPSTKL